MNGFDMDDAIEAAHWPWVDHVGLAPVGGRCRYVGPPSRRAFTDEENRAAMGRARAMIEQLYGPLLRRAGEDARH